MAMRTLLLALVLAASPTTTRPTPLPPQTAADVLRPVCEPLDAIVSDDDMARIYDSPPGRPQTTRPTGPLTPGAAAVLDRVRPQLDALSEAARLPSGGGQWFDPESDPPVPANWAWRVMRLGDLAAADAVRRADAGETTAAFERLQGLLAVSKLLVNQPDSTLIFFGRTSGNAATAAAGHVANRLTDEQVSDLRDGFLALRQTNEVAAQRRQGRDVTRFIRGAPTPFGDPDKLDPMVLALLNPPPEARAKWEDPLERDRMTRALGNAYEASADALTATGAARAAKLAEAERHVADAGWLGRALDPAADLAVKSQTRFDAIFALAAAAMDVRLRGPAALADYPDPTDGEPFAYRDLGDGGFELTSRHVIKNDQPLTFHVKGARVTPPA